MLKHFRDPDAKDTYKNVAGGASSFKQHNYIPNY